MLSSSFKDKVWKLYRCLPHCDIARMIEQHRIIKAFDYINDSDISIFAVNCIGGELYSELMLQFNSPLINTSIDRGKFVTLCQGLKKNILSPYHLDREEDILVLVLETPSGEIHIKFPHQTNSLELKEEWERRKKRINWDKIVLITDDRGCSEEMIAAFDQIPAYKKALLTSSSELADKYECCIFLPKYAGQECVGKYNEKNWLTGLWRFQTEWDYLSFLKGETNEKN